MPNPSAGQPILTRRSALLLPLAAGLMGIASCATHPPEPTSSPRPPTSEPPEEPDPTPDTTESRLAFVVAVSKKTPVEIEIDPVEMLFDDEAIARAKKDKSDAVVKDEDGNDYIPNDYYIPTPDPTNRERHPFAADGVIMIIPIDGSSTESTQEVTLDELRKGITERPFLMNITIDPVSSEITEMTEQYLP